MKRPATQRQMDAAFYLLHSGNRDDRRRAKEVLRRNGIQHLEPGPELSKEWDDWMRADAEKRHIQRIGMGR